jgi:hypothetical protein
MLFSLMEKLRRIFNRMTLRGDTLLPPCPPSQSIQASTVGGTIKIAPEHLRQRDLLAQASSSGGCAPVPHFTSMGGALMALQQFVAKMSVDTSQTESAGRALTLPTTTIISNRTPSPPASHIPIITPIEESEVPPEESEPERPMVEPFFCSCHTTTSDCGARRAHPPTCVQGTHPAYSNACDSCT